ncbi:hypothetical protein GJ496_009562 [Pomphorhynchus laevis]|nr:hypothetical protein GJ496_009562 [Pomphorhynchus laevis]
MSKSKLNKDNVYDGIKQVLTHAVEKKRNFLETIELVIVLKNLDPKRDKRFAGSVRVPYAPRVKFDICVLGDEIHCDQAKSLGVDSMTIDDLKKFNKDKKKIKNLVKKYRAFLASDSIIKQIPRVAGPGFNKAGKFPTPITHTDNLAQKIEDVKATIKFQMKRELCLNLAIANVGLKEDEIAANINLGVNFLSSLLKKGWQNVKTIYIKSTMGPVQRIY